MSSTTIVPTSSTATAGSVRVHICRAIFTTFTVLSTAPTTGRPSNLGAISGRTPMTRKWVHGVWYSKYQDYSTEELLEVIDGYRRHGYPLDNAVLDMGWHTNILDNGTGHNGKRHWTGYTWNRNLIPDPKALIDTIHSMGLTLTLNDHPHDGLRPGDERYADFARSLGYDPEGKEIPQFDPGSRRYMEALFRYGHGPTDSLGLDLWWVDWQQNYIYPYVAGTNTRTLPWLNEIFTATASETASVATPTAAGADGVTIAIRSTSRATHTPTGICWRLR